MSNFNPKPGDVVWSFFHGANVALISDEEYERDKGFGPDGSTPIPYRNPKGKCDAGRSASLEPAHLDAPMPPGCKSSKRVEKCDYCGHKSPGRTIHVSGCIRAQARDFDAGRIVPAPKPALTASPDSCVTSSDMRGTDARLAHDWLLISRFSTFCRACQIEVSRGDSTRVHGRGCCAARALGDRAVSW